MKTGIAALAVLFLAGAATADTLEVDGTVYEATWGRPAAAPLALAIVEHGFTRDCARLRGTLQALVDAGLMTLCLDAPMAGGNPALADALAALIAAGGLAGPDGQPVPERIVVGGHSAGGDFAVRLGAQLDTLAPARLAGALLFEPVAAGAFDDEIRRIGADGRRPVLAVTAHAGACNAQHNAYPGLRAVAADAVAAGGDGFVGVELTVGSTHVDAEGEDTSRLGFAACGDARPRRANVAALRSLAATWAADMARGARSPEAYPGGATLDGLVARGRAIPIE